MELRQLTYFVAVAEEGQFTRAAARVNVAQPAISAQIRRLERELGETLFVRDPRTAGLTAAGAALLPHARAALAAAERGRDTIASLRGLLHGRLRVGVSGPGDRRLATALGAFHRAHPAIEIAVVEGRNDPLVEALAAGELDAALIGLRDRLLPPRLSARVVATEPLVVAVACDHPLARRGRVTLARLRDEPIATLARGTGLRAVLEGACRAAGFEPRIVAEASELGALAALAGAGLGVAPMPRSGAAGADVVVLELTRPRLSRRTALAWNAERATPAARAFLELAREHLP
jgi:DNA-binding transcriptional LysR family regulator